VNANDLFNSLLKLSHAEGRARALPSFDMLMGAQLAHQATARYQTAKSNSAEPRDERLKRTRPGRLEHSARQCG
jgi:hypothetical protein